MYLKLHLFVEAHYDHIVCILYYVKDYQSSEVDEKQMTIFVTGGKRVAKIVQNSFPSARYYCFKDR